MSALVQAQKLNRLVVFSQKGWGGKTFMFVYIHVSTGESLDKPLYNVPH